MNQLIIKPGPRKTIIVERREAGALKGRHAAQFTSDPQFRAAARVLSCDVDQLRDLVDRFEQQPAATWDAKAEIAVDLTAPTPAGLTLTVRGRLSTEGEAITHADPGQAFRLALEHKTSAAEPLIQWERADRDTCCAVDVDFHGLTYEQRYSEQRLYELMAQVQPSPAFHWSTHGRGMRLMYLPCLPFTAAEMAGVGALCVAGLDPWARVEIKTVTRHPLYPVKGRTCGRVEYAPQKCDLAAVARWLGKTEVGDGEVERWLADHGYTVGQRYGHERCPVRPHEAAGRDPVVVREAGIYCHACAGRGVTLGHRVPGWFPFSSFVGGHRVSSLLAACIRNLTHWEHAQYVVQEMTGLTGDVAELAYRAAMRLTHPDDPRISGVFAACRDFVRFDRYWATSGGEEYTQDLRMMLQRLPACQYVSGREGKPDGERITKFSQHIDLSGYGYTALTPVWGMRIFSHFLPLRDTRRVSIVLQTKLLKPDGMSEFRARYVRPEHREMSEEDAWQKIESALPGLDRDLVRLLIAAKGCAEGEIGLPPLIYLSGPTGSGKTETVKLAALLSGDSAHSVSWSRATDKVRASIRKARETGTYCTFDEVLKCGKHQGVDVAQTMEFMLNLTSNSLSHKMYIGPVALGSLPVITWTDTSLPYSVQQHAQLARRLVHVRLPTEVKWHESLPACGVGQIDYLRTSDPAYAAAGNVIVSCVIDRFFRSPMSFHEISRALGYGTVADGPEAQEGADSLRRLFHCVCDAPAMKGADAKRWPGKGWKVLQRTDDGDFAESWKAIADDGWCTSERCAEADWTKLLRASQPVRFDLRAHGAQKIALRFVSGNVRGEYATNQEITNDNVELVTGPAEDSADRPGNAECEGFDWGWIEGLPQ